MATSYCCYVVFQDQSVGPGSMGSSLSAGASETDSEGPGAGAGAGATYVVSSVFTTSTEEVVSIPE